jgi:hypothetical protein
MGYGARSEGVVAVDPLAFADYVGPASESGLGDGRKQAEQKGLPYQTYIKSLLHETLAEREKRKAG